MLEEAETDETTGFVVTFLSPVAFQIQWALSPPPQATPKASAVKKF